MDIVKLGPTGMKGTIWDEFGNTAILQILISYDSSRIKSIQFVYAEKVGMLQFYPEIYGNHTGPNFSSVVFDHPSEFLTSVSGKYSEGNLKGKLTSITFGTNKRKYGPFGMVEPPQRLSNYVFNDFNYEFGASDFGGFHGCVCDSCICSIGVYVRIIESRRNKSHKRIK